MDWLFFWLMEERRYILASASPRRRELIQLLGLPFELLVAGIDEEIVSAAPPAQQAVEIARLKATAVANQFQSTAIVLGADTIVELDGKILGKPRDEAEARRMLRQLRGKTHRAHTGIALVNLAHAGEMEILLDVASVEVPMRRYGDDEIENYVASGDPLDKAGAYGIQHRDFRPAVYLKGCFSAVMGLPLCHVAKALGRLGVVAQPNVAADCQEYHNYECPVFKKILPDRWGIN